jgi:fibronectin-binding autotransporter adhesin
MISNLLSPSGPASSLSGRFLCFRQVFSLAPSGLRRGTSYLLLALFFVLGGGSLNSLMAASGTWNGAVDANWSTILNWSGVTPPGTGNTATFNNAGNSKTTLSLGGGVTVLSIVFDTSSAAAYTIGSGAVGSQTLTFNDSGAITINSTVTTSQLFNANVVLGTNGAAASYTFTNNSTTSGELLTIAGAISGGVTTNAHNTKTLTLAGAGDGLISGVISGDGSGSGSSAQPVVAIVKNGTGTWTLSGNNTYTGTTTVNGGDLSTGTFTLSTTGAVSIASGATYTSTGTLNLTPDTTAAQTFISGAGTLRLRNSSSTASAPDIYWNPTGNATSGASFPVTIASNIDVGTGTRYFNGISNRNDYERYGGDLVLSGNLSGSANLTFTGTPNTGAAGGPWQMAYTLAGDNSAFTGGIILTDGANLTLNNANALTSANSVTFTPTSGAVSGLYLYGRNITIGALSGTAAGTMNIRNGSLVTDNNTIINPSIVRSNAILTVQQNTNTTFNGVISDGPNDHGAGDSGTYYTLGLAKAGTGSLTLGGTNTYTGGTTVSAGTLFVNNTTGSGTGTNTVTVNGTGTLSGSGTITGAVNVSASGAAIKPGATAGAVGTLRTGALTLSSASLFSVDMTSTTADQLIVTGAVNITSASLQLDIPNGTAFTAGQQFTIISNDLFDTISGTFSNAPTGTDTIDGYLWIVSYTGGTGNDFVLTAVPEPSTWAVGLLALAAIAWRHRKRLRALLRKEG